MWVDLIDNWEVFLNSNLNITDLSILKENKGKSYVMVLRSSVSAKGSDVYQLAPS